MLGPAGNGIEVCAILSIVVANEIVRSFTKGRRLTKVLRDPLVGW